MPNSSFEKWKQEITITYLPCSKIQFGVANLVHFRRDIKLLQNRNWDAQWILRCVGLRKKKPIPKYMQEHKSTHFQDNLKTGGGFSTTF